MTPPATTFRIRVRPGAKRNHVGGVWGEGAEAALNVWVTKPANGGAANTAVIEIVASALGVRKHQLSITTGHTSRTKLIRVETPPADVAARLATLHQRSR